MTWGIIFNIMRYSISDGPGIRTTVFLKGCPLHCRWCHNPESQSGEFQEMFSRDRCLGCGACIRACPRGALTSKGRDPDKCTSCRRCVEACSSGAREGTGRKMTVGQVMAEVEKDIIFYDQSGGGVTFSGGEPLAQPDFLKSLLRECRKQEISTALDTSGYCSWDYLRSIAPEVDLFLFDIKIINDERHREVVGVSNRGILENLKALTGIHGNVIVRFPVIPGYTDSPENIEGLGKFLAQINIKGIEPLPYHKIGIEKYRRLGKSNPLEDLEPPSGDDMGRLGETLEGFGLKVIKGGNQP